MGEGIFVTVLFATRVKNKDLKAPVKHFWNIPCLFTNECTIKKKEHLFVESSDALIQRLSSFILLLFLYLADCA